MVSSGCPAKIPQRGQEVTVINASPSQPGHAKSLQEKKEELMIKTEADGITTVDSRANIQNLFRKETS